ncbi:MAG: methylenetetrahydrofolate reductase [Eubacteriales bacterium]
MRISEILKKREETFSFELFPPKHLERLRDTQTVVKETSALNPSFISCTYGASGGGSEFTVEVSKEIKSHGIPALSHLTCVSSSLEKVEEVLERLKSEGLENILALRGDYPAGEEVRVKGAFSYASELVAFIKRRGEFCVGGACYPEGHPESLSLEADIINLKKKVDAGAEFLTTQLFFDNNAYYGFRDRAARQGIKVPILAGVMPVVNASRIGKMIELSKCSIPPKLADVIAKYGSTPDMERAGIEYAVNQITEIMSMGFKNIHIYIMNKPNIARAILEGVGRLSGEK